jgi:hypothetical protein
VFDLCRGKEAVACLELFDDFRISGLYEYTFPGGNFIFKFAVETDRLYDWQVILFADTVIVFAKSRCDMNNAGAVFGRNKIAGYNIMGFFVRLYIGVKLLVFDSQKLLTFNCFDYFVFVFEHFKAGFGKNQKFVIQFYFDVFYVFAYGKSYIRNKRPGRCCPDQKAGAGLVFYGKPDINRRIFYLAIALCNLVL